MDIEEIKEETLLDIELLKKTIATKIVSDRILYGDKSVSDLNDNLIASINETFQNPPVDYKFNSNFDDVFTEGSEVTISDEMLEEYSIEDFEKILRLENDLKLQEIEDQKEKGKKTFAVVKITQHELINQ